MKIAITKRGKRDGKKLLNKEQLVRVIEMLKELKFFPNLHDFEYEKVKGEEFYKLNVEDPLLKDMWLRINFYFHSETQTIWILNGYKKKSNAILDSDKRIARQLVKEIKRRYKKLE